MSPPTSRLLPLACCLLLLTAGCSALVGSPEPEFEAVAAGQFELLNKDDEPHTVHVTVLENGSVVNETSVTLVGQGDGKDGPPHPYARLTPNPMADPGNYTVVARIDDGESETVWLSRPRSHLTTCERDDSPLVSVQAEGYTSDDRPTPSVLVGC